MSTLLHGRRGLRPVLVVLLVLAASLAAGARAADPPPLVSVGGASLQGNTASGSVGSTGKSDACLNDQHSGANPSSSGTSGLAQINDSSCNASVGQSSAGTTGDGSSGAAGGTRTAAGRTGSFTGTSTRSTRLAAWVFASQASGLRIASVRYLTAGVASTKRFRVLVTLRDIQGRLVRHAIVSTGRVAGAKTTVSGLRSTFTNRLGQARIALPVTTPMLGKHLLLRVTARTPTARALRIGSVLLPRRSPS